MIYILSAGSLYRCINYINRLYLFNKLSMQITPACTEHDTCCLNIDLCFIVRNMITVNGVIGCLSKYIELLSIPNMVPLFDKTV